MGGGGDTISTISADLAQLIFGHLDPRFFLRVARVSIAFRSASRRGVTQDAMEWKACVEREVAAVSRALRYGRDILYVPDHLRTEKVCLAVVSQDASDLKYIPKDQRTERVCLAAVKGWGVAIKFVPEHLRTEKVCLTAVKENPYALQYLSEEHRTEGVVLAAVKHSEGHGSALLYVPKDALTEKICVSAVSRDGLALQYVPKYLRTEKVCLAALKHAEGHGSALQYVPEHITLGLFYKFIFNQPYQARKSEGEPV